MFFISSLILVFGSLILATVLFFINGTNFFLSLLFGVLISLGVLAVISCIIMLFLILIWDHLPKKEHSLTKFRWFVTRDIAMYSNFWLKIRVTVDGLDKIPTDRKIIFYSNHQNFMDIFIYYQVLKKFPHATLFKKELLDFPLVRAVGGGLGGIPLDRNDDRAAAKSIIQVIRKVKAGETFFIFPEGTRTKDTFLNEYKAGSFKIAQKTESDIVILLIDNAYKITKRMVFIPTHVKVDIVDVIRYEDFPESTHELSKLVEQKTLDKLMENRKKYKYLKIPKRYQEKKDA